MVFIGGGVAVAESQLEYGIVVVLVAKADAAKARIAIEYFMMIEVLRLE